MYRSMICRLNNQLIKSNNITTFKRVFASGPQTTGPSPTSIPPYIQSSYNTLSRQDVTSILLQAKHKSNKSFSELAEVIGHNEVYTTSAIYGQHVLTQSEAEQLCNVLNIDTQYKSHVIGELQNIPYRGTNYENVQNDPVIYRFAEVVKVYGTTLKALIHEKYGMQYNIIECSTPLFVPHYK